MIMPRASQSVLLVIGALAALAVSAGILLMPDLFYASYGIDPAGNIALLNELKAPAGAILLAAGVMLAALFKPSWHPFALFSGVQIFLCFGLGRVAAMARDGLPSPGLIWVAGIELVLGLIFAWNLLRHPMVHPA